MPANSARCDDCVMDVFRLRLAVTADRTLDTTRADSRPTLPVMAAVEWSASVAG